MIKLVAYSSDLFLAAIVKLFYDNSTEASYSENEKKQYVSLKVYRPFAVKEGFVKLSGFRVVVECSSVNATLRVYEMSLGPSATFESMDEPIEVVYLIGSKEYKLIQKLIRDMEDAKEREKEKYLESVKQEFIEGKLTFDSPLEAYVEHMNEMKAKEVSKSYSVEPEILSFDEEDENDGG